MQAQTLKFCLWNEFWRLGLVLKMILPNDFRDPLWTTFKGERKGKACAKQKTLHISPVIRLLCMAAAWGCHIYDAVQYHAIYMSRPVSVYGWKRCILHVKVCNHNIRTQTGEVINIDYLVTLAPANVWGLMKTPDLSPICFDFLVTLKIIIWWLLKHYSQRTSRKGYLIQISRNFNDQLTFIINTASLVK